MAKILVVDDKQENLEAAIEQLEPENEVYIAKNFASSRELLEKEKFDVVMTDVMMPGEKGGQGPEGERFVGQLMPLGLVIALLALQKDVPQIFIVSDTNHHNHPVAWALDSLRPEGRIRSYTGYSCPIEESGIKNWIAALKHDTTDNAIQRIEKMREMREEWKNSC